MHINVGKISYPETRKITQTSKTGLKLGNSLPKLALDTPITSMWSGVAFQTPITCMWSGVA